MTGLPTGRTTLRRLPDRGSHDRAVIDAILDAAFVCHVGFVVDGQPFVIPTGYVRVGDEIVIHGSSASRMLRSLAGGIDACVTVTLVDGLVLARSAFHHSVNYRSVVILGRTRLVTDDGEKMGALRRFTDHIATGRFEETRPPDAQELKGTALLAMPLGEASAKVRTGPPKDDAADLSMDVWAGVVPLVTTAGAPIPDAGIAVERTFDVERLIVRRASSRRE